MSLAAKEEFSGFDSVDHLPVGEQFRQLSLMLLMTGRAGPEFTRLLAAKFQAGQAQTSTDGVPRDIMPDDYRTPLIRIVDQESMVNGTLQLFSFVQENLAAITDNLKSIKEENPVLISIVDTNTLMEDAIIIRNAFADSVMFMDYATQPDVSALLETYRGHTVFLRNQVEYARFYEELDRITDTAVNSVGGKMDAYQRMFNDEFEASAADRLIESTEFSVEQQRQFDLRAATMTEEIMQSVMDSMNATKP